MANEKRLISAKELERQVKVAFQENPYLMGQMLRWIRKQPTVDAVEVVRCKDCAVPHNKWTGCPKLSGLVPPPDFYCAYGERKDDGN